MGTELLILICGRFVGAISISHSRAELRSWCKWTLSQRWYNLFSPTRRLAFPYFMRNSFPKKQLQTSRRLLFVDDEDSIRATLPLILQERGFSVKSAASVREALNKIKTHRFDVVLSDLNIHKLQDGYDVVRAMRKANPRCVAIILTAYPNFVNAIEGVRLRIDEYFVKPANVDSLVAVMEDKLARRGVE